MYKTSEATVSPDGIVHLFPNVEIDALCGDEEPSEYGIWEEKDCTIEVIQPYSSTLSQCFVRVVS